MPASRHYSHIEHLRVTVMARRFLQCSGSLWQSDKSRTVHMQQSIPAQVIYRPSLRLPSSGKVWVSATLPMLGRVALETWCRNCLDVDLTASHCTQLHPMHPLHPIAHKTAGAGPETTVTTGCVCVCVFRAFSVSKSIGVLNMYAFWVFHWMSENSHTTMLSFGGHVKKLCC